MLDFEEKIEMNAEKSPRLVLMCREAKIYYKRQQQGPATKKLKERNSSFSQKLKSSNSNRHTLNIRKLMKNVGINHRTVYYKENHTFNNLRNMI